MDSFLFSVFWNCSSSSSWHLPIAGDSQTPLTVASDVAALEVADLHRKALHQSCMYLASFLSGLLPCRLSTTSYRSIGRCGASWWQNIKPLLCMWKYGKLPSCPVVGPLVLLLLQSNLLLLHWQRTWISTRWRWTILRSSSSWVWNILSEMISVFRNHKLWQTSHFVHLLSPPLLLLLLGWA